MKRGPLAASSVLAGALALAASTAAGAAERGRVPSAADAPKKNGSSGRGCAEPIRGRVVDGVTGDGVARARVELRRAGVDEVVRTDVGGAFAAKTICAETGAPVAVIVTRADYEPQQVTVRDAGSPPLALALEPRRIDRLDDIVVEAPAPPRRDSRPATTLDGDALEGERGRELADILAQIPGVATLGGTGGTIAKPIVRGQYGRRLLILFDGIRHEGQKWGLDHAPEVDPFAAGSLTVVKGAGTVLYGPDAIGGVIRIDPPPLPTTPGVGGEATLVGVSNGLTGTAALRLDGAHEVLPGFAWAVDGNLMRSRAPLAPDYPLDNTGTEQWNLGATVGYADHGIDLKLTHRRYFRKSGICLCISNENPADFFASRDRGRPLNSDLYTSEYRIERPFQRVAHNLWLARAGADLGDAGRVSLVYAHQEDDREELDLVRSNITSAQADFNLETHSARAVYHQPIVALSDTVRWLGSAGADFSHQENIFRGLPLIPNYRGIGGGVFVDERLQVGPVEVEAGFRFDVLDRNAFLTVRNFNRLLNTAEVDIDAVGCTVTEDAARCPTNFQAPSATLGALWTIDDHWSTRINVSSAIRFPNVDEQFINGTAPTSPIFAIGNPTLGPERTWGSTATGYYDSSWMSAEVSVYANYTDDYIYLRPPVADDGISDFEVTTSGSFPQFLTVGVDALFYGGDGGVKVKPPGVPLEARTQISIVRGTDRTNGGAPLVFVPPDRGTVGLTFVPEDFAGFEDVYADVSATFVDRQRRFDPDADLADPPPGYVLVAAAVGAERPVAGQRFMVSVEGRNLTNARYRDYTSLRRYFADEIGLEVLLRLGFRFGARANEAR
ncbi:MAG: TonB-dependent receptor [Myxococcota bacterium]